MKSRLSHSAFCGVVLAGFASPLLAQTTQLTDLGVGYAWGLNDSGQAILSTGLYSNGAVTPTGLTGYLSVNANGQVAGTNSQSHAAIFNSSTSTTTDLGLLPGAPSIGAETTATAINASGEVVGFGSGSLALDGFLYSNGSMSDLGYLPGGAAYAVGPLTILNQAFGINDAGAITGFSLGGLIGPDNCHAYVYQNGTYTDLGYGLGYAINNSGEVTGVLSTTPSPANGNASQGRAFFYVGSGSPLDLGTLPGGTQSAGYAINNVGMIVGVSDYGVASQTHAMVYNGVMTDLNSFIDPNDPLKPYVTLTEARGINSNGLILARGVDSRTQLTHAYLLTGPGVTLSPGVLSFGGGVIGSAGAAQTLTLTNVSTAALTLGQASIASGPFAISNNSCGATLAPAATCTVAVTFTPTASGDFSGTLTVVSDGMSFKVPLTGAAAVSATLTPSSNATVAGTAFTLNWNVSPGATCQASGGGSGDGWSGTSISGTGSKSITEGAEGDYVYTLSCAAGSQTAHASVTVIVNYPAVTVTVGVSTSNSGQTVSLTWSSTNATSCTATGGTAGDGWAGQKAVSGSVVLTEPAPPAGQTQTISFSLTCNSSASGNSAQVSKSVKASTPSPTATGPAPSTGGGGGALDELMLLGLIGIGAARAVRSKLTVRVN